MAKSYVTYVGDGTTTNYAVTFPYLSKSHVNVLLDGEETSDYTWITDSSIQLNAGYTGNITIIRVTPTEPLVDFTDGSVLTENQLDIATVQSLYVAEETQDAAKYALGNRPGDPDGPDGPGKPGDGVNWNAEGKKIINLANGTATSDAVNKGQLDALAPSLEPYAKRAEDAAEAAEDSADRAEAAAGSIHDDAIAAENAANAAKDSQDAAKVSEDNAKLSESAAKESETKAKASEDAAKVSEDNAKTSETNAKNSENQAAQSAADAALAAESVNDVVAEVGDLVDEAEGHALAAQGSANDAAQSASDASDSADKAELHELNAQAIADSITSVEEAPEDGKQYARKDGGWSEVEATSGDGGVEAQPPVAFAMSPTENQSLVASTLVDLIFNASTIDTNSSVDLANNKYVIPEDGLYQFNVKVGLASLNNTLSGGQVHIKVDGVPLTSCTENYTPSDTRGESLYLNEILDLNKGQEISLMVSASTTDVGGGALIVDYLNTSFSGHMVSSITEGSGGGDYTPEPMVWEDKLADRTGNTEYTNNYDSPMQVTVSADGVGGGQSLIVRVDNEIHGRTGSQSSEQHYMMANFTVPSGSTYSVENVDNVPFTQWREAKMPVAVGTGGDSIWTEEDGVAKYDGDGMEVSVNGTQAMTIASNRDVYFKRYISSTETYSLTTDLPSNLYIDTDGTFYRSTATSYTAEEVDKKLAIKDKLIEKLSERLDELEQRIR